jgi:diguanylate cyclase (GGDEF)-like protein
VGTRGRAPAGSAVAAWVLVGSGALGALLCLAYPASLGPLLYLLLPVASIVASFVGARRNQVPGQRSPWYLLAWAQIAMFGAAVLRAVVPGAAASPPRPIGLVPDILTVPGYVLFALGLLEMLRRRRAGTDDPARTDALLIGSGTGLALWAYLMAPGIWSTSEPTVMRTVAGLFPTVDLVILVIVAHLVIADGKRPPSLWLLGFAGLVMFAADLCYAVGMMGLESATNAMPLFDALCLIGYVAVGAAALHPSMRTLTEPQLVVAPRRPGRARTVVLSVVLAAPPIMITLRPTNNGVNDAIRIVLMAVLTAVIIRRIMRITNSWREAELDAQWRATHDSLTRLPNRELLTGTVDRWGTQAVAQGKQISLLFIDLDRFKSVNDMWGHQVGDEVLCAVAGRLSEIVRSEDLVCRIDADEFVIALATDSHSALVASLAQRLIDAFGEPFVLPGDKRILVTPSIGIASAAGPVDALELLREADTAMYQAKAAGRNTVRRYDVAFRDGLRKRVGLEQALRGALERGELGVHYQPLIDLGTDELVGFEALMRWSHPELGMVSPVEFIPLAEETGLIVESGAWLLEQAASQLVRWTAQRGPGVPPLHVSVNVSVRQLRTLALVDVVRDVLARTGLPASALWLEVTESVAMDDPKTSLAVLARLRELGVTLCIDDFGTGYSSLSYLTQLPARIVKIDRSLVQGIGTGGDHEEIVQSVIAMAHGLGRQVVAEGVETVAQRDRLRELGCDLVQGYLYGAPRTAEANADWIALTRVAAIP